MHNLAAKLIPKEKWFTLKVIQYLMKMILLNAKKSVTESREKVNGEIIQKYFFSL